MSAVWSVFIITTLTKLVTAPHANRLGFAREKAAQRMLTKKGKQPLRSGRSEPQPTFPAGFRKSARRNRVRTLSALVRFLWNRISLLSARNLRTGAEHFARLPLAFI